MDIRSKHCRKQLTAILEKGLKQLLDPPSTIKYRPQDQMLRMSQYESQKHSKQQLTKQQPIVRNHSKSDHAKFYDRTQSQLEMRNERLQQSQEKMIQLKLQTEIQEATFHPQISKYSQEKFKTRTGNEYYHSGIKWLNDKVNHIEVLKESALIKQQQSESVMRPIVNKQSEKILQKNSQDFYQRMSNHQAKKKNNIDRIRKDTTPTFKPKINKSSQHLQSVLNKDLLQVNVDLAILEQIRQHKNKNSKENIIQKQQPSLKEKQYGSAEQMRPSMNEQDVPSFRIADKTVKKQPRLSIEFNSPKYNVTEMMYEYLAEDNNNNEYYNSSFYQ